MIAAFDYTLHGKGGAAPSIDTSMHALVDAEARRPPAPRRRHRDRHLQGRREAHHRRSSATRSCGCRGAGPASSSASTSPRSRRRTRMPSAASWAATASPRGATPPRRARRTAGGSSTPRRPTSTSTGSQPVRQARRARTPRSKPADRSRQGRRPRPRHPRARLAGQADGRALHRRPRVLEFLASAKRTQARGARHQLPRPLPAHEGQADAARPAGRAHPSRIRSRG